MEDNQKGGEAPSQPPAGFLQHPNLVTVTVLSLALLVIFVVTLAIDDPSSRRAGVRSGGGLAGIAGPCAGAIADEKVYERLALRITHPSFEAIDLRPSTATPETVASAAAQIDRVRSAAQSLTTDTCLRSQIAEWAEFYARRNARRLSQRPDVSPTSSDYERQIRREADEVRILGGILGVGTVPLLLPPQPPQSPTPGTSAPGIWRGTP